MSAISKIIGRQVLDSRGNPTVEADVWIENKWMGRAAVPSGASTGKHEAVELRDNDKSKYLGRGVEKAVANVNQQIAKTLLGKDALNQLACDQMMIQLDGTPNKSKLGANAILAVSLAIAKASAQMKQQSLFEYIGGGKGVTLPIPLMNILNGGVHADNKIDFQEFMIVPLGAPSFSEGLRWGVEIFHQLKSYLKKKGYSTNVGDEGGFAPEISSNEEAIESVMEAIHLAGFKSGTQIGIAMDAASSEMYNDKTDSYTFYKSSKKTISSAEMVAYWKHWTEQYPIVSIEDGMAEDDWKGWKALTQAVGKTTQLVGDDLFVTNVTRLQEGIDKQIANSILIKVNQIGTLSETIDAVRLAQQNNFTSIMSHRSGETEDNTIADLAVGLNCGQIKTGSASRSDRMSKYNQLLRIEEELGKRAIYATSLFSK